LLGMTLVREFDCGAYALLFHGAACGCGLLHFRIQNQRQRQRAGAPGLHGQNQELCA